jgi:CheY-like chemotaxis protein
MSRTLRALVVDDESSLRFAVRGILEHVGMDVVEAANGREALALLEASAFQLVVTDVQMPLMDGLELLRAIRQRPEPQPKVVVMSARAPERQLSEALCAGAFDYLQKPFEVAGVIALARRVAALSSAPQPSPDHEAPVDERSGAFDDEPTWPGGRDSSPADEPERPQAGGNHA